MPSPKKIDFEWDLSKENIKPLPKGRSAQLLSIVLAFQKTPIFTRWCAKIRKQFEQALVTCPPEHKLQLYDRYIRWVEEAYPSLGAASELRSILFRCVKDSYRVRDLNNHPTYVDAWLRLASYCDAPSEVFRLLFHHGVGTLSADFYIAWCDHIRELPEMKASNSVIGTKLPRLAAILAHALRTGAQPATLLEERAEQLLDTVVALERAEAEERDFEELTLGDRYQVRSTEETRRTLAPLRTTEPESGGPSVVPSVRIGNAIKPEQTGLCGRSTKVAAQSPQKKSGLSIYRDAGPVKGLSHLPAALQSSSSATGRALRRMVDPENQSNEENVTQPTTVLDRKTSRKHAASKPSTSSQPTSTRLTIFKDETANTQKTFARPPIPGSSKPRGLCLLPKDGTKTSTRLRQRSGLLFTLDCLKSVLEPGAFSNESADQVEEVTAAADDCGKHVEFFCHVDALYSHHEEMSFEMLRAQKIQEEQKPKTEACFSLDLDDPFSKQLMEEIAKIVAGEYEPISTEFTPVLQNKELVEKLDAIVEKSRTDPDYQQPF